MIFSRAYASGRSFDCVWVGITFCILSVLLFLPLAWAGDGLKLELPRIAVVSTGGTIAEKTDPHTGGAVPAVSGKELVAAVPGLSGVADISVHQLCIIDSSPDESANMGGFKPKG